MSNYEKAADLAERGWGDKAQAFATLAVADAIRELVKTIAPKSIAVSIDPGSWLDPAVTPFTTP